MATTSVTGNWGLILVDPQKDLVWQDGASAVPEAEKLLPVWKQLLTAARQANAPIVVLANSYAEDTQAFSEQGILPHCVAGTPGAELVPELEGDRLVLDPADPGATAALAHLEVSQEVVVYKQSPDVWQHPLMEHLLDKFRQQGAQSWLVAGVAVDSAVKATILGLRSRQWPTYLLADAIQGVTDSGTVTALEEIEQAGASLIESATALIHWKKASTQSATETPTQGVAGTSSMI